MSADPVNVQSSTLNVERSKANTQAVCSVAYDLGFITAQAMHAQMEINSGNFEKARFIIGEMVGTIARCNLAARDLKEEVGK